jgi:hypothetical protein
MLRMSGQSAFHTAGKNGLTELASQYKDLAIARSDLGTMNRVLRQNVSICLFESCSHLEFRPILHSLLFAYSRMYVPCC